MTAVIDVHGLTKSFNGVVVVNGVDLNVEKGEIFGFLGPNGSGKTTTIRMLCGLLTPDSGTGHCLGFDILTEQYAIKLQAGYMTQRFSYYDELTIGENLDFVARLYGISNRRKVVADALEELGLAQRKNQLTGQLSGGWKQRLALAAAMLHKPALLLLDEPTAGVDPKARREFWDQLHRLSYQGVTTLVSTHYMDEAERCTRLAYIKSGEILVQGRINEVIAKVNLTTYEVTGTNIGEIAELLRSKATNAQVTAFGEMLHVSGHDNAELELVLATLPSSALWKKIPSTLEDAFIDLIHTSHEEL